MLLWTSLTGWEWVFEEAIASRTASAAHEDGVSGEQWSRCAKFSELPSHKANEALRKKGYLSGRLRDKGTPRAIRPNCFLRVERRNRALSAGSTGATSEDDNKNEESPLIVWFGGTAFDCLADKDLLAEMCSSDSSLDCLVPRSQTVMWDVRSVEEFELPQNDSPGFTGNELFVLKPPLGCQGVGIEFCRSKTEVLNIVMRNAACARNEPHFLRDLLARKGRIPGWVLQTYIPSMLVLGGRKFHARAYVLVHEISSNCGRGSDDVDDNATALPRAYFYDDIEIRAACNPYSNDYSDRDAHITNGAGGSSTQRLLVEEVPELDKLALQVFLHGLFAEGSVIRKAILHVPAHDRKIIGSFASDVLCLAALDIMVDSDGRAQLLEINAKCPAAPRKGLGSEQFQAHLVRFAGALLDVAVRRDFRCFVPLFYDRKSSSIH